MKRYYIVYKGRVQGVGFRYTITMLASKYKLTGWVRNLENGNVDAEVQGESANINAFVSESLKNGRFINIEDYSIKEIDLVEKEKGFSPRYF